MTLFKSSIQNSINLNILLVVFCLLCNILLNKCKKTTKSYHKVKLPIFKSWNPAVRNIISHIKSFWFVWLPEKEVKKIQLSWVFTKAGPVSFFFVFLPFIPFFRLQFSITMVTGYTVWKRQSSRFYQYNIFKNAIALATTAPLFGKCGW